MEGSDHMLAELDYVAFGVVTVAGRETTSHELLLLEVSSPPRPGALLRAWSMLATGNTSFTAVSPAPRGRRADGDGLGDVLGDAMKYELLCG